MTSLRQLRFLVALAEELNFSRAAAACHVTQPTLSTGLKELEDTLGIALAERTKRSVILTPVGHAIAERARSVLAEVRDIEEIAERSRGLLRGTLRLGSIPTIGPFLIPKALPLLRVRFPDLKVYLREELTEPLVEGLIAGRLDVILIALPFDIGALKTEFLFEDEYQLATPLSSPVAAKERVGGDELADMPLLLLEKGHCLQRHALTAFPNIELPRDDRFAATSLNTLISMVEEGLGTTLLPQVAIDAGVAKGHSLNLMPLEGASPRRIALAWRHTSAQADDFKLLAEIFRMARNQTGRPSG